MRLATRENGCRDGQLVVVSKDARRCLAVPEVAPTLQSALDDWETVRGHLEVASKRLEAEPDLGLSLELTSLMAPLPRAFQWVDASGYLSHMERVRKARGAEMPPSARIEPVIYQGLSDRNLSWCEDIPSDASWGTDLEGEISVITGDVGPAPTSKEALEQVRLLMLVNDVSLRALIPAELQKGFGFFHSKPASAFGPFAVTPDELGDSWRDGRLFGRLKVEVNGEVRGDLRTGEDQDFSFADILQYATRTRGLSAGSIVGAGTVSNRDSSRGVACIAEQRILQQLAGAQAESLTRYLLPGDTVTLSFSLDDGREVFGRIHQMAVAAKEARRRPRFLDSRA
ncbi:fumarylacetoacetate hydrolase family protein [Ottowia thiooxydans]|uniref:Fumarylacetoacetate (FAA) hydrolase n=1 Tax=Ottowia thiooxydans TaxID=219182 RepID=A0ABV2QFG9_9BURK